VVVRTNRNRYTFIPQPTSGDPEIPKIPASCWDLETARLLECNKAFVELVGYPLSVLQNNFTCFDLVPKSAHQETRDMLSRLQRDVQYAEAKALWIAGNGEVRVYNTLDARAIHSIV
jgi:PAS domain-containing protein